MLRMVQSRAIDAYQLEKNKLTHSHINRVIHGEGKLHIDVGL